MTRTYKTSGGVWLRRVGAVALGLVAIFALSIAIDIALLATFLPDMARPDGPAWQFSIALAYRGVISVFGCYLASRFAPDFPFRHALALAAIGEVLSILGAVAFWGQGNEWYAIAVALLPLPCAFAGYFLAQSTSRRNFA